MRRGTCTQKVTQTYRSRDGRKGKINVSARRSKRNKAAFEETEGRVFVQRRLQRLPSRLSNTKSKHKSAFPAGISIIARLSSRCPGSPSRARGLTVSRGWSSEFVPSDAREMPPFSTPFVAQLSSAEGRARRGRREERGAE